ncbi:hypothetical protein TruAng_001579 [Truncatella angustata]|nr:hypothetical protein TruAng_001579 [Truncatella angustata]
MRNMPEVSTHSSSSGHDPVPSITQNNPRHLGDPYGGLAVIAKTQGIVVSPISEWDLAQKRAWPPPLYQAYCEKHFLQECLVYYSLEAEKLEKEEARLARLVAGFGRTHGNMNASAPRPTRVQPRRGAKEAAANKVAPAQTEPKELRQSRARIESFIRVRQLHLSWSEFCARLQVEITQVASTLYARQQKKHRQETTKSKGEATRTRKDILHKLGNLERTFTHEKCPFENGVSVECRYCQCRPEGVREMEASGTRVAPVAPMHFIEEKDIEKEQVVEFGGLVFAVDLCGDEAKIILLDVPVLEPACSGSSLSRVVPESQSECASDNLERPSPAVKSRDILIGTETKTKA